MKDLLELRILTDEILSRRRFVQPKDLRAFARDYLNWRRLTNRPAKRSKYAE